jgi:hypothetical protein
MNAVRKVTILLALLLISLNADACGKERWSVKTVSDKDNGEVSDAPERTSIHDLTNIAAPINLNVRKNSRYSPTELKTFEVAGVLKIIKHETDGDYHLVIADQKGRTMIVEAPEPSCAMDSRFLDKIKKVRQAIDQQFGEITRKRRPSVMVAVTGVGFFDKIHGQEGVAPNGIELHPIVAIEFR